MNDAENGYRRSNSQRQRQNHGARESATLAQSSKRLSDFSEMHGETRKNSNLSYRGRAT
jgi:hypothetical protein